MATDIDREPGVREPSMLDALIPLAFMIGMLALSVVLLFAWLTCWSLPRWAWLQRD